MCSDRPIGWKRVLAVVAISGATALPAPAQTQTNLGSMAIVDLGKVEGGALETGKIDLQTFRPTTPWDSVPQDGWTKFEHGGKTLKFAAPVPAVPLLAEEQRQWGWDLATFRITRLKDRKVLYVYELSDAKTVEAVLSELEKNEANAAGEDGTFWTAIGVKYDIESIEDVRALGDPRLYSLAAIPMKLDDASYEFIKTEHDPAIFSKAVGATVKEFPRGSFTNFEALTDWSALAKDLKLELKDLEGQKTKSSAAAMTTAYLNSAWKGPFAWQSLTPLTAFIAVDRNLNIKGVKPLRILTSETAWAATAK